MARINQEEYEVLKGLDDKWKWIARDETQQTYAYKYRPIKSKLRGQWESNRNDYYLLPHDWLQCIKWEDEEPCRIAELIEEYECSAEHAANVIDKRLRDIGNALGNAWKESEETEVKSKQKLIEKWEMAIESAEFYGKGKEEELISYMRDFVGDLNQLEEPEVLSQEWIDKHVETTFDLDEDFETEFIKVDDLQNIIVPNQEEVDRVYKDGYEKGKKQHTYYKGYLEGLADKESINPERSPEVDQHKELLDELNDLYARKNQDYGNSFDESLDEDGLLVLKIRLGDKYKRFSTLINQKNEVVDESMRDTLIDLANYALMGVMWMGSQEED